MGTFHSHVRCKTDHDLLMGSISADFRSHSCVIYMYTTLKENYFPIWNMTHLFLLILERRESLCFKCMYVHPRSNKPGHCFSTRWKSLIQHWRNSMTCQPTADEANIGAPIHLSVCVNRDSRTIWHNSNRSC